MRKTRFTEEQIAFALRQAETGTPVVEVCRKMGNSEATYYNWKRRYGGLGVSELRRLKQLEEENARLKRLVADLSLDKEMLQEVVRIKSDASLFAQAGGLPDPGLSSPSPPGHSHTVFELLQRHVTAAPARRLRGEEAHPGDLRSAGSLRLPAEPYAASVGRLADQPQEDASDFMEEGLNLRRMRPLRQVAAAHRTERPAVTRANDCWSMDFVADQLFNGQRIRALTVVDNFGRECLAITVDTRLKGDDVVATMDHLKALRGLPRRIQVENGSEFISKALDQWAYEHQVTLDFSRPGKPTDNPHIESFNGSF